MPTYKLNYFDIRGLAEALRLTFSAADVKFEDVRYNQETWPAAKANFPNGKLPCLEVDGVKLPQSRAILRYLGREFELDGKGAMDKGMVDVMLENMRDFESEALKYMFEKNEEKKAEIFQKLDKEIKPAFVKQCETFLDNNKEKSGYLVGKELTIADIALFTLFDGIGRREGFKDLLDKSPTLKKHSELVKSNERIAGWLKARKDSEN